VLSAILPETVAHRLNSKEDVTVEEDEAYDE
jgi:regulator of extracellular matrix RemA (YlzA/DUF370 family)